MQGRGRTDNSHKGEGNMRNAGQTPWKGEAQFTFKSSLLINRIAFA